MELLPPLLLLLLPVVVVEVVEVVPRRESLGSSHLLRFLRSGEPSAMLKLSSGG